MSSAHPDLQAGLQDGFLGMVLYFAEHSRACTAMLSHIQMWPLQANSLADNQTLTTLLPGQNVTVYLKPVNRVVISGVQTAANVTQADVRASKVPCLAQPCST